jgi:hypothetical protein
MNIITCSHLDEKSLKSVAFPVTDNRTLSKTKREGREEKKKRKKKNYFDNPSTIL